MKLSIRSLALLTMLAPTLLTALGLSVWHTGLRVRDARAELESRGERESRYLADASELALLVADSETLQRLAASNLKGSGAAVATLFLDAEGSVLAAAGKSWEVGMARQCWLGAIDCAGGAQRYVFEREVRARTRAGVGEPGAFNDGAMGPGVPGELIGRVLLSFDPRELASIQRAVLLNSALITLGALSFAWALAHVFSRRLTVPVQQLSSVVARIRKGEPGARTVPRGSGELRELEEGVNAMADRVEAASAELNRRVDEAVAELSQTLIEREHRNRELDRALERAEAAGRAKDLFLARMSHELRTPLTTVTGFARMMQDSESPAQRADYYRYVEQGSRMLLAIVDDILTFVKLESGSLVLERCEFDLEACVEDAVMMQAPAAQQKFLGLVCHVEAGLPRRVVGDSRRISQVLSNLIGNAIKFTHEGHVTVRARAAGVSGDGPRLLLEVADTGIGIARESVTQLFQPFAQADESITRRFGGSGLGLSISSSLVQALDGHIELESEPGVGTRVLVELPLELAGAEADVEAALPRLRVALLCRGDSPHAPVLRDYLGRCFELVRERDPRTLPPGEGAGGGVDLLLALDDAADAGTGAWLGEEVPVLRLRPVAVAADPAQQYLGDYLPLPLRRRELLAACVRRAGLRDVIAEQRTDHPARTRPRLALRCMIVEDNELNRRMIATQLRGFGVQVSEAGSGVEALAVLGEAAPELVMLDVHMPEMDGVRLAAELARRLPGVPVYALTANVIGSEEAALAAAGVREVLYKPIDESKLVEVLRRHARGAQSWQVAAMSGIGREEIEGELRRLLFAVRDEFASGERAAAADAAHQLLGVARMFTTGALQEHCAELESALRGAGGDARPSLQGLSRMLE